MAHEPAPWSTTTPTPPMEQRSGEDESPSPVQTGEPAEALRPVPFERMLSVTGLTPAQALLMAVQLLEALQMSDPVNGEELPRAYLGKVGLMPSGDIEVGPPHADQATPATAVLEQLVHNARRLPAHPRPEQLVLLRRLEEATRAPLTEPEALARELEEVLTHTLGSDARERVSTQLASLADALSHVAPSVPAPVAPPPVAPPTVSGRGTPWGARTGSFAAPAPAAPRRTDLRTGSAGRASSRRSPRRDTVLMSRRTKGGRLALVVFVLVAALGASGYVLLGGPGADVVGSLGPDSTPATPATPTPTPSAEKSAEPRPSPRPQAISSLADRRAGPITGVVVQKTGPCRPGTLCPVRVTVRFRPASTTRAVGWKVGAARLCQSGIAWSPRITVTAQPGWTTVYANSSVRVPKGRSLALVALTTSPSRAQSRPVPVTGSSLRC